MQLKCIFLPLFKLLLLCLEKMHLLWRYLRRFREAVEMKQELPHTESTNTLPAARESALPVITVHGDRRLCPLGSTDTLDRISLPLHWRSLETVLHSSPIVSTPSACLALGLTYDGEDPVPIPRRLSRRKAAKRRKSRILGHQCWDSQVHPARGEVGGRGSLLQVTLAVPRKIN